MILFLHNAYRTTGGEERVVEDLRWLAETRLDRETALLTRDSAQLGARGAAVGLLRGGLDENDVAAAVRDHGARVVHAHNLLPAFGWRALRAAREAGARTVLHLHNYRLVCAVGTCFTKGSDCTRCHGRDTRPGVRLNCRGTYAEAAVYGASLALHQRRMAEFADVAVVPSAAAAARLRELGAPLPDDVRIIPHVVRAFAVGPAFDPHGPALIASRLAPEKGVDTAIDACHRAGVALVVAGDGPLRDALQDRARRLGADVTFTGRVGADRLVELRAAASVAVIPSRSAETFGLAAAEAMAAGLPVAATEIGALGELVPHEQLAPPGDPEALAAAILRTRGRRDLAEEGLARVRAHAAPEVVAPLLAAVYAADRADR